MPSTLPGTLPVLSKNLPVLSKTLPKSAATFPDLLLTLPVKKIFANIQYLQHGTGFE
jgi:hypothetical protein